MTSQRGAATSRKNTALFEPVADSLIFTNHRWRPFPATSPRCLPLTKNESGVRKPCGVCAAGRRRGIANSYVFFGRKCPRGWARFSGNAGSVWPLSVSGFGSCPADGTHKLPTTKPRGARLVRQTRVAVTFRGLKNGHAELRRTDTKMIQTL